MVHQGRKTSPPLLPSPILFRETLLQKLEAALVPPPAQQTTTCKLVLLRAPAGYGKTTLLADFARRNQMPVGWYFLDHTDTQLAVFIDTLTMVFCQAFPDLAHTLSPAFLQALVTAVQSDNYLQRTRVLEIYTAALEQHISHAFILCLSDYQEVNEEESLQVFLNHLLQNMPSRLSLVIESRSVPALELSPLLARRQLLGLGSNVLSFSPQEVQAYARLHHGFPFTEEDAERLTRAFDGWIVGLLLATPLGDSSAGALADNAWGAPALVVDRQALLAYIRQDVFVQEEQALTFLQETSVLPLLSALRCNALLQIEHAEAVLTHIERQGLFLTRVLGQSPSPTSYRLHPALRQLLSEDLQRTQPARATFLSRRVAELFHTWGDDEQAIIHTVAAQAYPLAVDIIVQTACSHAADPIQHEVLARWLDLLPVHVREQHPRLLLIQAALCITQREYLQAAPLLEKASQLVTHHFPQLDGESTSTLRAEILIARSAVVFQEGKYAQVRDMCHEALVSLSVDQTELRIPALLHLGMCNTLVGDYSEGLASLHQALQLSGLASVTRQTASIHSCLANSYSLLCNYALAEHHRVRAIAICQRLNDTQGTINNLIWMAILKHNTGAFQEAETLLQDVLRQAQEAGFPSGEAYTLFNLGAHALDRDALPQALVALEESLHLARHIGDNRLADQCLCELAMVYLLLNDSATAQSFLAQTTVATTVQPGYEALDYELIHSTVLLYQQDFLQASIGLRAFEPRAHTAHLKRAHIECLIRLAVCHYRLEQVEEMEAAMAKVVQIVTQGYFEYVPLIELRRFPDVLLVVQRLSDQACLPTWRNPSAGLSEKEDVQEQTSLLVQQKPSLASPPPTRLHIQAFGEPSVMLDGLPITRWHLARSLELCFFLLNHQRPIRKEQLVEALWSEEEEYVDQTVRSALHYLRKALGGSCLTSQGGVYTLNLSTLYGDTIWYDVTRFHYHYTQAQEALEAQHDEQAAEHFQAMADLYRGDYVQSFYSNWCIPRRDELRRQYMDARRELARIAWNQERWEESLAHWQQMVALDPCTEEAHAGLMRCYARLGKRSLAVRQYQRCTETLQRELAIAPGLTIQKLYQRLTTIGTLLTREGR